MDHDPAPSHPRRDRPARLERVAGHVGRSDGSRDRDRREGREGRRIGTLFTVGAERGPAAQPCLILDPLAGHPATSGRSTPDVRETIKELAELDGGSSSPAPGSRSACRYFESTLPRINNPGLGTRHIAAASISAVTGAVAVVVSESSIVRLYAAGTLITEILPELWLLHRYMPHIAEATLTSDRTHNLGIVSERTEQPSLNSR